MTIAAVAAAEREPLPETTVKVMMSLDTSMMTEEEVSLTVVAASVLNALVVVVDDVEVGAVKTRGVVFCCRLLLVVVDAAGGEETLGVVGAELARTVDVAGVVVLAGSCCRTGAWLLVLGRGVVVVVAATVDVAEKKQHVAVSLHHLHRTTG